MSEQLDCPNCGEACDREEVDVGVGVVYGPWHCNECGWTPGDLVRRCGGTGVDAEGHCKRCGLVPDGDSECPPGFLVKPEPEKGFRP